MITLTRDGKDFLVIDKYFDKDHYYSDRRSEHVHIHSKKLKKGYKYNPTMPLDDVSSMYPELRKGQKISLGSKSGAFNEVAIVGFVGKYILSKSTLTGMYYITEKLSFAGMSSEVK